MINLNKKIRYSVIGLILITLLSFFMGMSNEGKIKEAVSDKNVYLNKIDGYQYNVPEGFLINEEFMPYAVRFLSNKCVIEIYT